MKKENNTLFYSCLLKQEHLKQEFQNCVSKELKYQKIITLGKELSPFSSARKVPENIVQGCQSIVYLYSFLKDGKMQFEAFSEALISSGLAALLIRTYQNESPETVLKCPPQFLEELGIPASLTPGRSNGLSSIYLLMKQDALKFLINAQNN